jgi:hypothetical protein
LAKEDDATQRGLTVESVGGIPPYARRPRSSYYDGISAVTATVTGEVSPIKTERLAPVHANTTAHRATRADAGELASLSFSSAPNHP